LGLAEAPLPPLPPKPDPNAGFMVGGALCLPRTGQLITAVDPTLPPCEHFCTELHEQVHVAQQYSCCKRYSRAYNNAATTAQQEAVVKEYSKWVKDNRPAWECVAYTASFACALAAVTRPECCREALTLSQAALNDLDLMRTACRLAKVQTPCPFPP
jgi:hypothetical protein